MAAAREDPAVDLGSVSETSSSSTTDVNRRWSLLARIFKDRKLDRKHLATTTAGSTVFESYNLIKTKVTCEDNGEFCWKRHSIAADDDVICVEARHLTGPIMFEELLKFDNTGNVCVWPAEEVLAYYLLQQGSKFKNKAVIELGGGMTCLAGLLLASACKCAKVVLTDGSEDSIANLNHSIERNRHNFIAKDVSSRVLRWDQFEENHSDLNESFDYVITADCLFFDDFRTFLVETISKVLKPGGEAIIIAPKRGHSFDDFVSICKSESYSSVFPLVEVKSNFDDHIYKLSQYFLKQTTNFSPIRHQPLYISLQKAKAV